ncbi:DUF1534 domain-containing protein [Pseudomonas savastanoi pv. phaseolicola]|nr:DUF1534 domain-containing protein [Pseudomonas savastanoi pv. phaseolicola]MBN3478949.1 DUF1534 domain-containing protein [Pseudomonas savastanoi pv. phaseolicola]PYD20999.1 DUF1534 domain-containing protein [Pseudomonas savastanoi pv. glycinea]
MRDALRHKSAPRRTLKTGRGAYQGFNPLPVPGSLPAVGLLFQAWPGLVRAGCAGRPVHCRARSG